MWSKACHFFDSTNPSIPIKLDLQLKELHFELVHFVQTKLHFLFEVLLFRGTIVQKIPSTITSAYCPTVFKSLQLCDIKSAQRESKVYSANGQELLHNIYDSLHQEATEVIFLCLVTRITFLTQKK